MLSKAYRRDTGEMVLFERVEGDQVEVTYEWEDYPITLSATEFELDYTETEPCR